MIENFEEQKKVFGTFSVIKKLYPEEREGIEEAKTDCKETLSLEQS
jgi:hypothetical protein